MKKLVTISVLCTFLAVAAPAVAAPTNYYIWDDWDGAYADAEKDTPNTDDDAMCWAATASNVLEWTGWGKVGGMTNTDQMFAHFCAHWVDQGGMMEYGWNWWFDGVSRPGLEYWSSVDVPDGGNFYHGYNFSDYFHETLGSAGSMSAIDTYLHNGWGTGLAVYDGGHAITAWGFQYDTENPNYYTGVYVSDSDDDNEGDPPRPDSLRFYNVALTDGHWYLQNFHGFYNWYIRDVQALEQMPTVIPAPGAILLGSIGVGLVGWLRRRRKL